MRKVRMRSKRKVTMKLSLCREVDLLMENASFQARVIFKSPILSIRKSLLILGCDFYNFEAKVGSLRGTGQRGFWNIYEYSLKDILVRAHKNWRRKCKDCAARQHKLFGMNRITLENKSLFLNLTWDRVERAFRDHGVTL